MATIEEPALAPPARSLHRKLAQVMYEAERIPKNGTAPQIMGGYKFVQVGDAADFIRKALSEKNVTMMPTNVQVTGQVDRPTKSGGVMTTVDLIVTWTITDAESGESIEIQSFGAGADGGDKYSGKASTSAMKYALLSGFLLSTGDDTEQTDTSGVRHGDAGGPQTAAGASARSQAPPGVVVAEGGLIGIAALGKTSPVDGEVRQTDAGMSIGFVIGEGRDKVQVVAYGPKAEAFHTVLPSVLGKRVQVFGPVSTETMKVGSPKRDVTFPRVRLERLVTPDATFDFTDEPELEQPPDDVELVGEAPALGLVS